MKTNRVRVLVTGVDGDSGQGLVKALRLSRSPMEVHGCDASGAGLGAAFVRAVHVVPPASRGAEYVDALDQLCRTLRLDAVVPSLPGEIDVLCKMESGALPCGVPVVCLSAAYRDVFDDKLRAYRVLDGFVPLAPYADGLDATSLRGLVEHAGYPLIVKRRRGRGGDSFHTANGDDELAAALRKIPDPVVQAYIDEDLGEYTVGVFATPERVTSISFRRRLGKTGSSWFAQTVEDPAVRDYAEAIARASGLRGSANVQVRKSSAGVRLLEINARFSSLAPARAFAGFRDVEWSLAMALGRSPEIPSRYRNIRFQRFVHEMVDEGQGYRTVPQWSRWRRPREESA